LEEIDQYGMRIFIFFFSLPFVPLNKWEFFSPQQLKEITIELKDSNVNFLWVMRSKEPEFNNGFELEKEYHGYRNYSESVGKSRVLFKGFQP